MLFGSGFTAHYAFFYIYMSQMQMRFLQLLLIGLTSVASVSYAIENNGSFRSTKLGLIQQNYSGPAYRSFALGNPGLGVELTLDSGYTIFRYFFKARYTMSEGKQNFLNAGTAFNSKYTFSQFSPEIGVSFFPIPRREKGVNIFIWGVGTLSYNNLELKNLPAVTKLQSKEQSFGYGYGGGLGMEFILGTSRGGSRYLAYGELGFHDEQTDLVNTKFEVSGMTFSLGFGF